MPEEEDPLVPEEEDPLVPEEDPLDDAADDPVADDEPELPAVEVPDVRVDVTAVFDRVEACAAMSTMAAPPTRAPPAMAAVMVRALRKRRWRGSVVGTRDKVALLGWRSVHRQVSEPSLTGTGELPGNFLGIAPGSGRPCRADRG
nr:hypothetical protein [Actinomycetota bacterium]